MTPPARRTRVMVVDDAVVARLLVAEALLADPDLELAAAAPDGRAALDALDEVKPDVVVLDVEMPVLDGLATLKALRAKYPQLPVVMFSTLTVAGQRTTLDALTLGASDYVTKPSTGSRDDSVRVLREELLPKIKALTPRAPAAPSYVPAPRRRGAGQVGLVVVGSSTGGPNALAELVSRLPADLPFPVVVAQQMPAAFTSLLAHRLNGCCPLPVREAVGGELLEPGTVWIAQGGAHLTVARQAGVVRLVREAEPRASAASPSVDRLFRSAAETYGRAAVGVVLTGAGQDALEGCRALHAAGGEVWVQDERSSVVWGMAAGVVQARLADAVLPLNEVAPLLAARAGADTTARRF